MGPFAILNSGCLPSRYATLMASSNLRLLNICAYILSRTSRSAGMIHLCLVVAHRTQRFAHAVESLRIFYSGGSVEGFAVGDTADHGAQNLPRAGLGQLVHDHDRLTSRDGADLIANLAGDLDDDFR